MTYPGPLLRSILTAAILVIASIHSFADTYKLYNLGSDEAYFIYGFDDSGTVVISNHYDHCSALTLCYTTYTDGVKVGSSSAIAPAIDSDEGTPCAPPDLPTLSSTSAAVCNNGREVISATFLGANPYPGIYTGPDFGDRLFNQSGNELYLNGAGDILFNDPNSEFWFEAVRETPEPGSLLLLGTGLLASLGRIRLSRRRRP